jgi:tryptophan-rich sensory protein
VFGVVWPVLYGLLGYSSHLAALSRDPARLALHLAISLALAGWLVLDSCMRRVKEGVWLMAATALACCYAIALDRGRTTALLLMPLAAWLSFATLMSAFRTTPAAVDRLGIAGSHKTESSTDR